MTFSSLTERLAGSRRKFLIVLACVSAMGGPAQANSTAPGADIEARNEAIVREAFEGWGAGGNVFKLLAPDVVWTIHGSGPVADTYRGVEDFVQRGSRPLVSRLATPLTPRRASHLGQRRQGHHPLRRLGHHDLGSAIPQPVRVDLPDGRRFRRRGRSLSRSRRLSAGRRQQRAAPAVGGRSRNRCGGGSLRVIRSERPNSSAEKACFSLPRRPDQHSHQEGARPCEAPLRP